MRYLILRDPKGHPRSVGATAIPGVGLVAGRGQTLEVREGPDLEGAKLMAYMRKLLGAKRPSPTGKKTARPRRRA